MDEAGGEQSAYRVAEDVPQRYYEIEHTRMTLEAGWLGKFFGSATNAPVYIAGLTVLLFTLTSIAVVFAPSHMQTVEYLNLVIPVITLILGYLFGKST